MARTFVRQMLKWEWWKWGILGLASVVAIHLLFALELWREQIVAAGLEQRGVSVYRCPLFDSTPLSRSSFFRKNTRWIALPDGAGFSFEDDVSSDDIRQLTWLPFLRHIDFGRRGDTWPSRSGQLVSDQNLIEIGKLTQLWTLQFNYSNITDDGLKNLTGLQALQSLDLKRAQITDAGLVSIGKLRSLRRLSLQQTLVTGTGLKELALLKYLARLSLQSTPLQDGSLSELAHLPNLNYLDLDLTPITDASIKDLAQLKSLKEISVMSLSNEGMEQLKQALPQCHVIQGPN